MPYRSSTTKRLTYRRAAWVAGRPEGSTLEAALRKVCESRRTLDQRVLDRDGGGTLLLSRWEPLSATGQRGGIQAQILAFTRGGAAQIARTGLLAAEVLEVETQAPQEGTGFIEGSAFLVISEDHVIVTMGGELREAAVAWYLTSLLRAELDEDRPFLLSKVVRADQARAIAQHGVRSIHLDSLMYGETQELIGRRSSQGFFTGAWRTMRDQLAADLLDEITAQIPDLMFGVELSLKGKPTTIERLALGEIAVRIAKEGETDYVTVLGNGTEIAPDQIVFSKQVSVPTENRQIDHRRLWERMHEYLLELEDMRALDV